MTSLGSALPAICSTRAVRSRRSRRLSASKVVCGWPVQGGWNGGRKVTISSTGRLPDGEAEQLARGRIDPMRVPENHEHRLPARQTLELPDQRLQNPFL